jgi:hypothetical protein
MRVRVAELLTGVPLEPLANGNHRSRPASAKPPKPAAT